MWTVLGQWLSALLLIFLIAGTLLNLSRNPHWFVRGWDFPRMQICGLALLLLTIYVAAAWWGGERLGLVDGLLVTATLAMIAWQASHVFAYTPVAPRQVVAAERIDDANAFRLVISNVQMENRKYDLWMRVVQSADPDVLLALEVDRRWLEAIEPLSERYPYRVAQPQENYYGMVLLSRLELRDAEVRTIVQDDVPSIHAVIVMPSGVEVRFCGVHPRPPEPLRDESSSHRDAELVVLARELAEERRPAVIGGDLNDVAWSYTTRLFLKLSGLLDPRRGRGFYNTWNADHWFFRYPLDHVFHADRFSLRELRRLEYAGSDHFPMLISLQYEPQAAAEQPTLDKEPEDEQAAQEIIDLEESREHKPVESPKGHEEANTPAASRGEHR